MVDRTCPECKYIFPYPSRLKLHFETVIHCKKNIDEINNFFSSINLNTEYSCIKCKYIFAQKSSYNRHIKQSKCYNSNEIIKMINNTSNDIDNTITTTNIITNETNTTNIINNDTMDNDITSFKYIYLIEKFDVNNKEYIYKFGKTNREYSKRIKEHGYEANVLLILDVNNCNVMEKKILNILSNTENIRKCDFGNEYFQCSDKEYIKNIILKNIYN